METANLHLTHIEDDILNFSYSGARTSLSFIESIAGMLAGHTFTHLDLTAKWDGAPAIFVGINPENGKFFVATKGLFNKNPKINYTHFDIQQNHTGELADKLSVALDEFGALGITNILQGDLMFTKPDLREQVIDGVSYITFKPNTITYAVPVNSTLGRKIYKASVGVIFHTSYSGKTISDLKASYKVDIEKLTPSPSVWFDDATYLDESGTVTLTSQETFEVNTHLALAESIFSKLKERDLDAMVNHPDIIELIKIHSNKIIRDSVPVDHPKEYVNGLISFIHERLDKEKEQLKTLSARDKRDIKKKELHTFINQERLMLELVFEFQQHIVAAKNILIKKLTTLSKIGTFIETDTGYRVTAPEGFVAVDHLTNKAVKLVDRLEFSRANFQRHK